MYAPNCETHDTECAKEVVKVHECHMSCHMMCVFLECPAGHVAFGCVSENC